MVERAREWEEMLCRSRERKMGEDKGRRKEEMKEEKGKRRRGKWVVWPAMGGR